MNQAFPASLLVRGVRQVFDKGVPTKPLKTACMNLVRTLVDEKTVAAARLLLIAVGIGA